MNDNQPLGCTGQPAALGYILAALAAPNSYHRVQLDGLPSSTIFVAERDAMIAVTTAAPPTFRAALERAAARLHADVLLLRTGAVTDALMPVSADVVLDALPGQPWVQHDLTPWTDHRSLWLVPAGFGPSISVSPDGLWVEPMPPFPTLAQREAGIYRAQHALARLAEPVGVR